MVLGGEEEGGGFVVDFVVGGEVGERARGEEKVRPAPFGIPLPPKGICLP